MTEVVFTGGRKRLFFCEHKNNTNMAYKKMRTGGRAGVAPGLVSGQASGGPDGPPAGRASARTGLRTERAGVPVRAGWRSDGSVHVKPYGWLDVMPPDAGCTVVATAPLAAEENRIGGVWPGGAVRYFLV